MLYHILIAFEAHLESDLTSPARFRYSVDMCHDVRVHCGAYRMSRVLYEGSPVSAVCKLVVFMYVTGLVVTSFAWAASPDHATESPRSLWEIGVFGGAVRVPHYRGSDEYSMYALPFPYFLYRGKRLRAGREGVNGVLWSTARVESALSFGGSPPPRGNSDARQGMSRLGAVGEVGPGIRIFLTQPHQPNPLTVTVGLRGAASLDTENYDIAWQGLRGGLGVYYRNQTLLRSAGVVVRLTAGIDLSNSTYHRYFYGVRPEDAAAERPTYRPSGGYAGCSISASGSRQLTDNLTLGAYYRHDNISGAAYVDSPLVRTENNTIIGCALIWRLFRSKKSERIPVNYRETGALTEW